MTNDIKKSFIVSEDHYKGNIEELAQKTIKHGKITENGNIIIENTSLSKDDLVKLCLVIRFIAHEFNEEMSAAVRPIDLVDILKERTESVGSRLSILAKKGFVKKEGRGVYVVHSYKINAFLDSLSTEQTIQTRTKTSNTDRKLKKLTGVGQDIQELIDEGFLKHPKTVNEVEIELNRKTKYHQSRVIDATIRTVFVRSRKTLKRIPNETKGRAKWLYVNK